MFLHAAKLSLPHPISEEMVVVEAPLPPELSNFIKRIEANEKREFGDRGAPL